MKTIIISDAKSKKRSIIPYGLNLAKTLNSEVDVVHVIDPRTQQGIQGKVSDSQSISAGGKMSHQEIIEREKRSADKELDRILSQEASRLNYPLKINRIIEADTIEKKLKEKLNEDPDTLLIVNSEADSHIFSEFDELFDTINSVGALYLLVPPGYEYHNPQKVLLLTDYSSRDFNKYTQVSYFLKRFKPSLNAVDVKKKKDFLDGEMKSKGWLTFAKRIFSGFTINTLVLTGKNYSRAILQFIQKNRHDMMLVFKDKPRWLSFFFRNNKKVKLLAQSEIPVLYYSGE